MGSEEDYTVVDVDAHYVEPLDELIDYIDKERYRSLYGHLNDLGNLLPNAPADRFMGGRIKRDEISYPQGAMGPDEAERMMRHVGIDKALLFPNTLLGLEGVRADDMRMELIANAYIDYMLDQVVDPSRGIYAFILAPFNDPDAAAEIIDRVGDEKGIVGVYMVSPGAEPPFGNRMYDPIYDAAQRKGLPVVFHGGGSALDGFETKGYGKYIETHTLGFMQVNQAQLTSVTIQGVPIRFPDLEIVFMESGLFWVPPMMHRLDAEYLKRQSEAPLLEHRPSKYIENYYFGTQPIEMPQNESYLEQMIEMIGGPEQIMYASDYPHWDYDDPSVITERAFLTPDEKRQILAGTAEEVFGV